MDPENAPVLDHPSSAAVGTSAVGPPSVAAAGRPAAKRRRVVTAGGVTDAAHRSGTCVSNIFLW